APPEPGAVSLAQAGAGASRDEVLAWLLDGLGRYLADPARARRELRAASATIGRNVRVELADGTSVEGVAQQIDGAGRLLVSSGHRDFRIDAGDVIHLR
ncbi:MAG: biotin--[acetyl-CoA-carboxylase] ligase, partial [Acidimicrobiaceae bacterium]|nr:biotin--[acetyl-CoA-carboxylase] ligase [Acidimicrobiaceae bacterium]